MKEKNINYARLWWAYVIASINIMAKILNMYHIKYGVNDLIKRIIYEIKDNVILNSILEIIFV